MTLPLDYAESAGFLVGKSAKLADWQHRKECDETRRLIHYYEVRRWESQHPEHAAELHRRASKAWRERDPEHYRALLAERKRRYRERNKERVRAASKAYYAAHAEELRTKAREKARRKAAMARSATQ